jgi:hypothetical protein
MSPSVHGRERGHAAPARDLKERDWSPGPPKVLL